MDVSAVVCTHNRLDYLKRCIDSLSRQTLDATRFEVIVVDNASKDGTHMWVEQAQGTMPNLRYVHEPTLGLAHARNAGWRAAKSEVVAFLDDDALAAADWLEQIVAKFQQRDEKLAVLGGKVLPIWEAAPPDWLVPELQAYLSVLDWSPTDMVLTPQ